MASVTLSQETRAGMGKALLATAITDGVEPARSLNRADQWGLGFRFQAMRAASLHRRQLTVAAPESSRRPMAATGR